MKKVFLNKRVWRNSRDDWVSVESDPKREVTKPSIIIRCVPHITDLYQAL